MRVCRLVGRSYRSESSNTNGGASRPVMPGLDPGIHQKKSLLIKMMDCRVKPGNDERRVRLQRRWYKTGGMGRAATAIIRRP